MYRYVTKYDVDVNLDVDVDVFIDRWVTRNRTMVPMAAIETLLLILRAFQPSDVQVLTSMPFGTRPVHINSAERL